MILLRARDYGGVGREVILSGSLVRDIMASLGMGDEIAETGELARREAAFLDSPDTGGGNGFQFRISPVLNEALHGFSWRLHLEGGVIFFTKATRGSGLAFLDEGFDTALGGSLAEDFTVTILEG